MTKTSQRFEFAAADAEPRKSALYDQHCRLVPQSRIVPFAGYVMPVRYSSIKDEHEAVREAAGVFDCTHMGVLEFAGPKAADFLDMVTVNNVQKLSSGRAQYSQVLDGTGNILDDIIIYCRREDLFMVVVNAVNNEKLKAWFGGIISGDIEVDHPDAPAIDPMPSMRDLRDPASGEDQRVDIALQGPKAADIIGEMMEDEAAGGQLAEMKPFRFIETSIAGNDVIVSTTGYTGSPGFEIYVHPETAGQVFELILEKGEKYGVKPCGLGARDSLRIQAGLPLYGHELSGKHAISPLEVGYSWAVKLDKPFFIGKDAMLENDKNRTMKVVRLSLPGQKGVRPVREDDGVLTEDGECIGWILSATKVGEEQIALAFVSRDAVKKEDPVGVYYLARSQGQKAKGKLDSVEPGQELEADITGTVEPRFARF
ncbi:Aminomethyltransferase [Anaerohalosphaera lusitana]|uniref:Aminomethyltransferase n=1 Tax=Anaerohalosphaera lusitana TaxID=1936003 RepID=A0A1U9NQU6_9BACT|nr:glycine cleavage system aminomethyltransferase GcvT [Anaerohalosphaera lusitana]AQT70157.1 Aminomethyltransferase [Anaerohalosphaera lusitana]